MSLENPFAKKSVKQEEQAVDTDWVDLAEKGSTAPANVEDPAEIVPALDTEAQKDAKHATELLAVREKLGIPPTIENAEQPVAEAVKEDPSAMNEASKASLSPDTMNLLVELVVGNYRTRANELAKLALPGPENTDMKGKQFQYDAGIRYDRAVREKAAQIGEDAIDAVLATSPETQVVLAQEFFDKTIKQQGPGWHGATDVIQLYKANFRGTPFGDKFRQLHSSFLESLGHKPLDANF